MLLAALLTASGTAATASEDSEEGEPVLTHESEKLPIIVHLLIGDGADSGSAIDTVTARVMERLAAEMPDEDLAGVRTFTFFPAVALSADGDLILRLLSMPEVMSIERDRELQVFHEDTSLERDSLQIGEQVPLESAPPSDESNPERQLE